MTLRILALMLSMILLTSCLGDGDDIEYSTSKPDTFPNPNSFEMILPVKNNDAVEADLERNANIWQDAMNNSNTVNQLLKRDLGKMEILKLYPVTASNNALTRWDLYSPIGGDSAVPRFTIRELASSDSKFDTAQSQYPQYEYTYQIHHEDSPGSWVEFWVGTMVMSSSANKTGSGSFFINYIASNQTDPDNYKDTGSLQLSFSGSNENTHAMQLAFTNYKAKSNMADYLALTDTFDYQMNTAEGDGHFYYAGKHDWTETDIPEKLNIYTDWNKAKIGQSQMLVTGVDIDNKQLELVEIRECWNAAFQETYYVQINRFKEDVGDPTIQDERGDKNRCPYDFKDWQDLLD